MDPQTILRAFVERHPELRTRRVGVAVSAGADSTALAVMAARELGEVTLLHMNYGLRGEASDGDEALVRELGARLGVGVLVERVSPETRAEEELRLLRYAWFERCGVDCVLTAHTREDQAETVLFRVVRGTGPGGLVGILPVNGRVYRPLLEAGREELRELLVREGVEWREDASNADVTYRRNWIRHELLPRLREGLNAEADRALANLAEIAREDEEWIVPQVKQMLDGMAKSEAGGVVLDCEAFVAQPQGLQRRLMRALMERVKGDLREIEFGHVEAALLLAAESEGNGRIQTPGLDLMRSFGWMRVIRLVDLAAMPVRNFRLAMPVPGEVEVPEWAGRVASSIAVGCNYNESGESLDWEKVQSAMGAHGPLELRNWRPGDAMNRRGSAGPEKIKELFQKFRIPLWQRRSWPIVVIGDIPVWVGRFGAVSEFAARPETRTELRLDWTPAGEG